jgi:hypothetical protein
VAAAAAAAIVAAGRRDDLLTLAYAVGMGGLVATSVFIFDVSIQYVHDLPDIFAQVGGAEPDLSSYRNSKLLEASAAAVEATCHPECVIRLSIMQQQLGLLVVADVARCCCCVCCAAARGRRQSNWPGNRGDSNTLQVSACSCKWRQVNFTIGLLLDWCYSISTQGLQPS